MTIRSGRRRWARSPRRLKAGERVKSAAAVAIVGAGPYGLSLAAHLNGRGVPFRIFGSPLQVWREQMPAGMQLKSDGFASDLYDPERAFTLRHYCEERGIPYAEYGLPVRLDTFVQDGMEFQKKFVRNLEPVDVVEIRKAGESFQLRLQTGETVSTSAVVMATGINFFAHVPQQLSTLSSEQCTHSSTHYALEDFRDRRVAVIGGGASAIDLAGLLHEQGASTSLVSRRPLVFHRPPGDKPRSVWERVSAPNLGLGPGLRSAVYTVAPGLFRRLPHNVRMRVVSRHLGPSGGWFMKDKIVGKVQLHVGYDVRTAEASANGVCLRLRGERGDDLQFEVDHVICATGYRVAVDRIRILNAQLRAAVQVEPQSPVLSSCFESSVSGLYFIGVSSANTFGPLMRFALGAEFAANRVSAHLARMYGERRIVASPSTARS